MKMKRFDFLICFLIFSPFLLVNEKSLFVLLPIVLVTAIKGREHHFVYFSMLIVSLLLIFIFNIYPIIVILIFFLFYIQSNYHHVVPEIYFVQLYFIVYFIFMNGRTEHYSLLMILYVLTNLCILIKMLYTIEGIDRKRLRLSMLKGIIICFTVIPLSLYLILNIIHIFPSDLLSSFDPEFKINHAEKKEISIEPQYNDNDLSSNEQPSTVQSISIPPWIFKIILFFLITALSFYLYKKKFKTVNIADQHNVNVKNTYTHQFLQINHDYSKSIPEFYIRRINQLIKHAENKGYTIEKRTTFQKMISPIPNTEKLILMYHKLRYTGMSDSREFRKDFKEEVKYIIHMLNKKSD